jgi:hypothetical protein
MEGAGLGRETGFGSILFSTGFPNLEQSGQTYISALSIFTRVNFVFLPHLSHSGIPPHPHVNQRGDL